MLPIGYHKISELNVDEEYYQRNDGIEEDIVENFDEELFQTLDVNKREGDGGLWVVEGGNRTRALTRIDPNRVVACVMHNLDLDGEIELFHNLNSKRKALTSTDKLKGKVTQGQEHAVLVDRLIKDAKMKGIGVAANVSLYEDFAAMYPKAFERVWNILLEISPSKKVLKKGVLRGLFYLETNSEKKDSEFWTEELKQFLKTKGSEMLWEEMKATGYNVNSESPKNYLFAIREVLKKNGFKLGE